MKVVQEIVCHVHTHLNTQCRIWIDPQIALPNLEPLRSDHMLWSLVRGLFVPLGYPDSVAPEYAHYQLWDTIQQVSRSMLD